MKHLLITLVGLTILFLIGCATPYQKMGLMGGYKDIQLQEDVFKVTFAGNAYTDQGEIQEYALRRCAELTLEKGFDYFIVLDEKADMKHSTYTTPTQTTISTYNYGYGYGSGYATTTGGQTYHYNKPGSTFIIKCFKGEKPKDLINAYDARQLIKYLNVK